MGLLASGCDTVQLKDTSNRTPELQNLRSERSASTESTAAAEITEQPCLRTLLSAAQMYEDNRQEMAARQAAAAAGDPEAWTDEDRAGLPRLFSARQS